MSELKQNDSIFDFNQLDESKYESLKSCGMLLFFYPFCRGISFAEDLAIFRKLSSD